MGSVRSWIRTGTARAVVVTVASTTAFAGVAPASADSSKVVAPAFSSEYNDGRCEGASVSLVCTTSPSASAGTARIDNAFELTGVPVDSSLFVSSTAAVARSVRISAIQMDKPKTVRVTARIDDAHVTYTGGGFGFGVIVLEVSMLHEACGCDIAREGGLGTRLLPIVQTRASDVPATRTDEIVVFEFETNTYPRATLPGGSVTLQVGTRTGGYLARNSAFGYMYPSTPARAEGSVTAEVLSVTISS